VLVNKNHLSLWDIRELIRLIDAIDNYKEAQTINKNVAKLLQNSGVVMFENEVGWTL
jgi:hypothetical protein